MTRKKVSKKLNVYTDASGYGAGGYCDQKWFCFKWPEEIKYNHNKLGMPWMELFPITLAARMFGPEWSHRQIEFHTDNTEVVAMWEGKRTCKPHEAKLMEEFKLVVKRHQLDVTISHIRGVYNKTADAISRGKDLPNELDKKPLDIPLNVIQGLLPFQNRTENKRQLLILT